MLISCHKSHSFPGFACFLLVLAFASVGVGRSALPIGGIQGIVGDRDDPLAHATAYDQQIVRVEGIIHQLVLWQTFKGESRFGMFLQNPPALSDGNPLSSDGLFVYLGNRAEIPARWKRTYVPEVGDRVVLEGQVQQRHGQTELSRLSLKKRVATGLDLDTHLPAFDINPPSDQAEADRYWERHEGMRGRLPAGCIVQGHTSSHRFTGDSRMTVIRGDTAAGLAENPFARRVFRDYHPLDDNPHKRFDNGNGYRICLSAFGIKAHAQDAAAQWPAATHTFSTTREAMTGAILYNYETYLVVPSLPVTFDEGVSPYDNHPPRASAARTFSLATYNLENLYDFRNDPYDGCDFAGDEGCPGVNKPFDYVPADASAYRRRLDTIAVHITDYLHQPDILLLQELEDQDMLAEQDGLLVETGKDNADGQPDVLQDLAAAVKKRGGPEYRAVLDRDGADTRGIICGYLYRSDRVELLPKSRWPGVFGKNPGLDTPHVLMNMSKDTSNPKAFNGRYPAKPGRSDQEEPVFSRPVMLAGFVLKGACTDTVLYTLNNHFSSRPDMHVVRRKAQAEFNAAIARAILAAQRDALIVVAGDLNVFPRPDDPLPGEPSDQLGALYEAGLHNLHDDLLVDKPATDYTYVYSGQAGVLDHVFVSPALRPLVQDIGIPHINTDWNADTSHAFGASDHDPILVRFNCPEQKD